LAEGPIPGIGIVSETSKRQAHSALPQGIESKL